ncbi:MAG: coenzyme F420-0:L-glutamate ligase [Bacillota bacterium]
MGRTVGTTVRGIRAPIVKEGDDLVRIVTESVLKAMEIEGFSLHHQDVIGVTESLLARAQGNYASTDNIATAIKEKYSDEIAVVFPILSRNRFSLILKGIAKACKKIYLLLNYPSDEVGNCIMDLDMMEKLELNPYLDVLSEDKYRALFGDKVLHPFTGVDYIQMYKELAGNAEMEIFLANDPKVALKFTKNVLVANVHERQRTKRILKEAGAEIVYGLDELLTQSINGSGYNPEFGLLGSNSATESSIKLFPRNSLEAVLAIQAAFKEQTGKNVEVMIYGDGAFKDPMGKIWELADPVVSPGFTPGLEGTPSEVKLKYIADNDLKDLDSSEMKKEIQKLIKEKEKSGQSMGTTPRKITDLLGSLCDLTSGSGDKGTPIVLVQGYFDNFATE